MLPRPLVWLHGDVKTPSFSRDARVETGFLLRRSQNGESLGMPISRPLPSVGPNCHELRVVDRDVTWRIVYHLAPDAVVILEVFSKKTRTLPTQLTAAARRRLREYQRLAEGD